MKVPKYFKEIEESGQWTLFLDRDGTINRRLPAQYVRSYYEFEYLPKVMDALQVFSRYFRYIFIVTNQQGIGKEVMTHDDLHSIHTQMLDELSQNFIHIDQIYYCPDLAIHDSASRKPNPGMAIQAQQEFAHVDFKKSMMVGDTASDMEFGSRLGMKSIWLNGRQGDIIIPRPDTYEFEVPSLYELATFFL